MADGSTKPIELADFDAETVPETDVPSWAVDAWAAAPLYAAHRGDEEWTVQDFLYAFQPGRRNCTLHCFV